MVEPIKSFLFRSPDARYLGSFFLAYLFGCGFAQLLAVVPGTGISVWPPGGLFIATLLIAPRATWPWWIASGVAAELAANALWFDSPFVAAVLMFIGNALAAMIGAWIVTRVLGRSHRFETLREVVTLLVFGGGLAPVISATIGSLTLAWFDVQSQSFTTAWPLWWIGDATGVLIVAPLALVVFQNWRDANRISTQRLIEAGALGLVLLGLAALTLSGYLPFAYIITPPLLWAAVRFEFKGAAVALAILAVFTVLFTVSGSSQVFDDQFTEKHRQVMLQLFLAISAFSALVVAAVSREHQQALRTLEDSVEPFGTGSENFRSSSIWCRVTCGV